MLGAGAPIVVSLAALPGWTGPLSVVGMFVVLELFTNLVLETALYAGAAGVSQVALLDLRGVLDMAVGTARPADGHAAHRVSRRARQARARAGRSSARLMADTPPLAPEYGYYQRLLARDPSEAADLIERHIKNEPWGTVYDALLLPALNYAERDRSGEPAVVGRRSCGDRGDARTADAMRPNRSGVSSRRRRQDPRGIVHCRAPENRCACWAMRPTASPTKLALTMLAHALDDLPIADRDDQHAHAGLGTGVAGADGKRVGRLSRRSAAKPTVEVTLSGQAPSRRVARSANPRRTVGSASAGG